LGKQTQSKNLHDCSPLDHKLNVRWVPRDERLRPAKYLVVFLRREVAPVQRGNTCAVRKRKLAFAVGLERYVVAQNGSKKPLRLPSSWATEINLRSRYTGEIFSTKIGDASSPAVRFAEGGLPASWGSAAGVTCREPAASRMRPQTPAAEAARRLRRAGAV